jgi:methionyl-tRNA formyltransferase
MGTPGFAARVLGELIAAGHEIVAVYTRAPQPAGRGLKLTPSSVEALARAHGITVLTPRGFRRAEVVAEFAALKADAAIVVAYGVILPQAALDATRLGAFNLHASLLPRWRGAAPVQRAIMAGDAVTGVQVMRMEAGLDTGPILFSESVAIASTDTAQTLHDKLAETGARLALRFVSALERGQLVETPQPESGVTYADKISPQEARIDWSRPAIALDRHVRGLSPFPGAWFEARGERVKALLSRPTTGSAAPGEVLQADGRLVIACGDGALEIIRLHRSGKSPQDAAEFLRGFSLEVGDRLA